MRRAISRLLERLGLIRATFAVRFLLARLRPSVLWHDLVYRLRGAPDGVPLPSMSARVLVAGSPDAKWFLDGGSLAADSIRRAVARQGRDMRQFDRILDFGCGCGRVMRQWQDLSGAQVFGTDTQQVLLAECRRILPCARLAVNGPEPPLPFAGESFDLIYSLSVFTHLDEEQQITWRDEIRRLLKPGGLWFLTTQGVPYVGKLSRNERARFDAGDLVCQRREFRGLNLCQAFHPEQYVRAILGDGLSVIDHEREGARGNPRQDVYVLRRDGPVRSRLKAFVEAGDAAGAQLLGSHGQPTVGMPTRLEA
jgi:SAM-dependent methyltransferase